jgi:hypothetical protein
VTRNNKLLLAYPAAAAMSPPAGCDGGGGMNATTIWTVIAILTIALLFATALLA